jgi:predicted amidohydrolase
VLNVITRNGKTLDYVDHRRPVLPLVTDNTAHALRLSAKGRLECGNDADMVVLRKKSLEIVNVIAKGVRIVANSRLMIEEPFLADSTKRISLDGKKHELHK